MKTRDLATTWNNLEVWQMVLVMLVGLLVLYASATLVLGTDRFIVTITSQSMQPALYRGDAIIIAKTNDYKINDIIVFQRGNSVIVHRIVQLLPQGFKTKGDNNAYTDLGFVPPNAVYGKMVLWFPQIGHVNLWLAGK